MGTAQGVFLPPAVRELLLSLSLSLSLTLTLTTCRKEARAASLATWRPCHYEGTKANLRTNIMDFRGFDSRIISIIRGGILMSIGDFPESLSQAILVGIMLVGRLGELCLTASPQAVASSKAERATPERTFQGQAPRRSSAESKVVAHQFLCWMHSKMSKGEPRF